MDTKAEREWIDAISYEFITIHTKNDANKWVREYADDLIIKHREALEEIDKKGEEIVKYKRQQEWLEEQFPST